MRDREKPLWVNSQPSDRAGRTRQPDGSDVKDPGAA
jgi:hypothetical protein